MSMARKPRKLWSNLSPAYRNRLKRAGVTGREYNAGKVTPEKRSTARGHNPLRIPRQTDYGNVGADAQRRQIRKLSEKYGFDYDEALALIPLSERAAFLTSWQAARAERKARGGKPGGPIGRQRMDDYGSEIRELGFYG